MQATAWPSSRAPDDQLWKPLVLRSGEELARSDEPYGQAPSSTTGSIKAGSGAGAAPGAAGSSLPPRHGSQADGDATGVHRGMKVVTDARAAAMLQQALLQQGRALAGQRKASPPVPGAGGPPAGLPSHANGPAGPSSALPAHLRPRPVAPTPAAGLPPHLLPRSQPPVVQQQQPDGGAPWPLQHASSAPAALQAAASGGAPLPLVLPQHQSAPPYYSSCSLLTTPAGVMPPAAEVLGLDAALGVLMAPGTLPSWPLAPGSAPWGPHPGPLQQQQQQPGPQMDLQHSVGPGLGDVLQPPTTVLTAPAVLLHPLALHGQPYYSLPQPHPLHQPYATLEPGAPPTAAAAQSTLHAADAAAAGAAAGAVAGAAAAAAVAVAGALGGAADAPLVPPPSADPVPEPSVPAPACTSAGHLQLRMAVILAQEMGRVVDEFQRQHPAVAAAGPGGRAALLQLGRTAQQLEEAYCRAFPPGPPRRGACDWGPSAVQGNAEKRLRMVPGRPAADVVYVPAPDSQLWADPGAVLRTALAALMPVETEAAEAEAQARRRQQQWEHEARESARRKRAEEDEDEAQFREIRLARRAKFDLQQQSMARPAAGGASQAAAPATAAAALPIPPLEVIKRLRAYVRMVLVPQLTRKPGEAPPLLVAGVLPGFAAASSISVDLGMFGYHSPEEFFRAGPLVDTASLAYVGADEAAKAGGQGAGAAGLGRGKQQQQQAPTDASGPVAVLVPSVSYRREMCPGVGRSAQAPLLGLHGKRPAVPQPEPGPEPEPGPGTLAPSAAACQVQPAPGMAVRSAAVTAAAGRQPGSHAAAVVEPQSLQRAPLYMTWPG